MSLEVVQMPLSALNEYEGNAKIHDEANVEAIRASIRRFGMCDPIGVWTNPQGEAEIVEGHGRKMALEAEGYEVADVIFLDHLTDEERRAYALAHNQTTLMSDFDLDILEAELDLLADFDMADFGFDVAEEDEPVEVVEDEVPEDAPSLCKMGDVWQLGRHRMMCGDSTDADSVAKLMDGARADLALTDPPYGIDVVKNGKVGADFGVAKKGEYRPIIADSTTDTARDAFLVCSEYSLRQIIFGGNYFTEFLPSSSGWLVWDKRCDSGIRNTFADGELAWCSFHTPVRIYRQLWNGMIREGEKDKRVHPTQKPVGVLAKILSDFLTENESVLDLFGGSGSTLIACEQLNRTCYMMELDPHYCDVIIERWQNLTGETARKVA